MRGQGSRSGRSGENFSHSHRSGGRDAADREAKRKARAGISGRSTPRASSSSRTERRFRDKMGGERKASKADILEESNEGKIQLNAAAVEDAEKQQGRIEALTRQMQNITQPTAVPEPIDPDEDDNDGDNKRSAKKKRWKCICCFLILLLAIGGGVAYIFGTSRGNSCCRADAPSSCQRFRIAKYNSPSNSATSKEFASSLMQP
ncbi:unnamed protein product [Cylindrotheca closterium]|uniref:Uncharacterized protein n=1 Tax=Cylindrotheca closterium TaxID=2856 RepID=A0AAD2FNY9_9STRA|nr:unnamed protein product [Cylindrotheca closterium]